MRSNPPHLLPTDKLPEMLLADENVIEHIKKGERECTLAALFKNGQHVIKDY